MFNAYAVLMGSEIVAYFRTEVAAHNFVDMWNSMRAPVENMSVQGVYVVGLSF